MIKKYHRQENCLNVVAPKINSEISNEKLQVSHRMTIFTSEKFNCWMFQLHTQSSRLVKVVSTMGKYKQKFNRDLLTLSTLSIFYGLKYKSRFSRETQNRALSSHFDPLITPKPKLSQLEAFPVSGLVSLTLNLRTLFSNFRKKTGNFAALVCCATAN